MLVVRVSCRGFGYSAFEVDIYAARVDTAGNVMVENSAIEVLNGTYQRALRATSVVDAAGATHEPNGVMFGWLLESDAIGLIEDIRARIYDPVAGEAFAFGQGCVGPGGALPGAVLACQWGVFTPRWNAFGWITLADIDLRWRK